MKSLNIVGESDSKLYKRKKDMYCVYKKCKNYKLRNKNVCRPHEKIIVNQSTLLTSVVTAVVTTVISSVFIYLMYNFVYQSDFDFMYNFEYHSNLDTGFKYVGENVQKLMEYSMNIFSNIETNTFYNFNMCAVLTDVEDESFVTKNTICYILINIRDFLFEYILVV